MEDWERSVKYSQFMEKETMGESQGKRSSGERGSLPAAEGMAELGRGNKAAEEAICGGGGSAEQEERSFTARNGRKVTRAQKRFRCKVEFTRKVTARELSGSRPA